jgi:hypothetical protein
MSQPIRVEGWAYTPGARVNLRLQFRSQSTYARVKAHFHNPSGGVIKLEGVTHTREESGAAHTEVVLTGNVPQNAALGTYECRSVEGLTGERKWAPIFEDPGVQHPRGPTPLPRPKWGRVPRARASLEGGKPNPPARWPLTNSRASLVLRPRVVT